MANESSKSRYTKAFTLTPAQVENYLGTTAGWKPLAAQLEVAVYYQDGGVMLTKGNEVRIMPFRAYQDAKQEQDGQQ